MLLISIGFLGVWFADPNYASGCQSWEIDGQDCLECVGTLYNKTIKSWEIQFYEWCCPQEWMLVPDSQDSSKMACITNTQWNLGINMNSDCLINWQCSYNIYKTLWIRQSDQNPSVSTFVQDIVLGITMFLGTAITIILIISGILYILAAILGKSNLADMAKKWIFNSILWLVLVSWSYAIVRLVQFVATAGGW